MCLTTCGGTTDRLDVARAPYEKKYLTPYRLLAETENPNSKQKPATSVLGGALMRSILGDLPYPEALYENAILRVRATQDNDERHTRKVTRAPCRHRQSVPIEKQRKK